MSNLAQHLIKNLVELRRDWAEHKEELAFVQRNHYLTAMELFKEMDVQGLTEVSFDGVTLRLTEDGEEWVNDPMEGVDDD